jgi:hypothetical protein
MPQSEIELTQQNLVAYRQRWQAVAAVEAAEREASSVTERWQQMNALLRLAKSLNIVPPPEDASLDESRQRWQVLYAHEQAKGA